MSPVPFSRPTTLALALFAGALASCTGGSSDPGPSPGGGGSPGVGGAGGQRTGGIGAGGVSGNPGGGGAGEGGSGGTGQAGAGGTGGGTGGQGGSSNGGTGGVDASPTPGTPDAGGDQAGGNPTYEGELPLYKGPPVGPEVKMACPGDPTAGFAEYEDTFHLERPYDIPINTRFRIEDGIYYFSVQRNDKPHSRTTMALHPRTEARYKQNFTEGVRMWNGDVYLERNTNGSVIMQVHTTTTGIGPIYLHVEGNNLEGSTVKASDIPGGMFENWFNLKVSVNGANTESQVWINNCLKTTQRGVKGNGINYFKNGVYHCEDNAVCRTRFKNVKLYQKL